MPEIKSRSLDGIRKTNTYRIIPRVIKYVPALAVQFRAPLEVPLPPRVKLWRPMFVSTLLLICLVAGWSGLTVLANRTLNPDGSLPVDITTIPIPGEDELIGPVPLSLNEPDVSVITATFMKLLGQ